MLPRCLSSLYDVLIVGAGHAQPPPPPPAQARAHRYPIPLGLSFLLNYALTATPGHKVGAVPTHWEAFSRTRAPFTGYALSLAEGGRRRGPGVVRSAFELFEEFGVFGGAGDFSDLGGAVAGSGDGVLRLRARVRSFICLIFFFDPVATCTNLWSGLSAYHYGIFVDRSLTGLLPSIFGLDSGIQCS
jgi:hypothetical protein